jgi:hypothetical protein
MDKIPGYIRLTLTKYRAFMIFPQTGVGGSIPRGGANFILMMDYNKYKGFNTDMFVLVKDLVEVVEDFSSFQLMRSDEDPMLLKSRVPVTIWNEGGYQYGEFLVTVTIRYAYQTAISMSHDRDGIHFVIPITLSAVNMKEYILEILKSVPQNAAIRVSNAISLS